MRTAASDRRDDATARPVALARAAAAAPVVLRLATGVVMAAHGWQKLTGGPAGFAEGVLAGLGVPAAGFVAWLVTFTELIGGLMVLVGLLTRLAAVAVGLVLVGAIALVKVHVGLIAAQGAGAELDLALLAGLVAIALLGPGKPSVDHAIGLERGVPVVTTAARR